MIVTKKSLSRRTILRGAGAAVALPLLDGMVPAFAALRQTAANPARRLGCFYVPMGACMAQWTPPAEGPLELSPILMPLAPFKDRTLVLSGLDMRAGDSTDGGGPHSRCQTAWLTGMPARKTEGPDIEAGISMDQIAAKEVGAATELPSLELALETVDLVGSCDSGYACTYTGTLTWRSPTMPLPMEGNPRAVFERLFGASDSTEPSARQAYLRKNASLLDSILDEVALIERGIGPSDRAKLGEYLESVRDVERRIQKAEAQVDEELPVVDRPSGVPAGYADYAKLMFDLLVLAYQTDVTRVATFMMGRELSLRTFPEIGVPEPHHPLSHHGNDPEKLEKQARVNILHLQLFSQFLEKLRSIPDGDGTLLDNSLFLYGSGMSNSNEHMPYDLPTLVVAGEAAGLQTNRHVRFAAGTPLANLHLLLLDRMGVQLETFADDTGRLQGLSGLV